GYSATGQIIEYPSEFRPQFRFTQMVEFLLRQKRRHDFSPLVLSATVADFMTRTRQRVRLTAPDGPNGVLEPLRGLRSPRRTDARMRIEKSVQRQSRRKKNDDASAANEGC